VEHIIHVEMVNPNPNPNPNPHYVKHAHLCRNIQRPVTPFIRLFSSFSFL